MYMCIFRYFNHYLPDFLTATSLGFIFGFLFLDICFNAITNHLLRLWSGSTDSKTLDYQRNNPQFSSVQFSCSVVSDFVQLHESQHARPPCPSQTPGVTQTHVHQVGDAIQPSHPLSSPTPPAPNPSQHQCLFQ